jgi:hypothetical protein
MTDQESVQQRKAASAAGAVGNSGLGVDGDDPSVADAAGDDVGEAGDESASAGGESPPDPVTGSTDKAVGSEQAADNDDRESPS